MSAITTHVLDTARGQPAMAVPVRLEVLQGKASWQLLAQGATNTDGRLAFSTAVAVGCYRLSFDTQAYFAAQAVTGFYPEVSVTFWVRDPGAHHHVPLLLSPYGYTTYRGS